MHTRNYRDKTYNHYIALLDQNLEPKSICFEPIAHEYWPYRLVFLNSLEILEEENKILISGGLHDKENFIARLDYDKFINWCKLYG